MDRRDRFPVEVHRKPEFNEIRPQSTGEGNGRRDRLEKNSVSNERGHTEMERQDTRLTPTPERAGGKRLPGISRKPLDRAAIKEAIERILSGRHDIAKQSDLLDRLTRGEGLTVSQASLSRLLREMHVKKVDGVLSLSESRRESMRRDELRRFVKQYARGVRRPAALVTVTTQSGFARSLAVLVKRTYDEAVVGSVADDDTAILLVNSENAARRICNDLEKHLPK